MYMYTKEVNRLFGGAWPLYLDRRFKSHLPSIFTFWLPLPSELLL